MAFFHKSQNRNDDIYSIQHFAEKEGKKILFRYTCIYLAYLMVLTIVLFSVIGVSGHLMEQKTIANTEKTIRAGMEELDYTLTSYERAASSLMDSHIMQSVVYSVHDKTYDIYDAHRFFKNVTQTLETEPDCGYLMKNGMLMVPNRYYYVPAQYFAVYMNCVEYPNYDAWMSRIASTTGSFLPALQYRDYSLTPANPSVTEAIVYLVRKGTASRSELFFILIQTERLEQILMSAPQGVAGNLTLSVTNGKETTVLYENQAFPAEDCDHTITYTGESGLTVTVAIADSVIDAEMQEARTGFYMFTMIFILIGLFLAIVMAYHNTRPLTLLLKAATQYDTTGQFNAPTSRMNKEYEYLVSILSNSSAALKSYEKELERYAAETRYWSFVGILMGEETEMAASLQHPPYTLLLISPYGEENETCSLLLSLIRKYVGATISRSGFLCAFRNAVIVLVEEAVCDTAAAGIAEILDTIPDLRFRQIFVTGLTTPSAIRDAYAQATYMLTLPPPNGALRQELKLASEPAEASNAGELFMQFGVSTISGLLTSGQIDTLTGMFDNLIAFFRSGGYADETSVRHIYTSCALSLSAIRSKFPGIAADITIPDYAAFPTVEGLLLSMRETLCTAHTRIRSSYESSDITGNDPIMAFITANIGNPNLYSKLVMEKFEISDKELQHHIKRCTGMSFFSYIEKTRMEQAKHLLLTTAQSVTTIGEACGYNSNSTFNRAFNRFYGMSPAEMRKQTKT